MYCNNFFFWLIPETERTILNGFTIIGKTLIEKLKEKTLKKEAILTKTTRDDEFKLDFGQGAITVDQWSDEHDHVQYVYIAVFNERGDKIDTIYISSDDKEDYKFLEELHVLAKRADYIVDDTFKIIFKEIESDKVIENVKKSDDFHF